MNYIEKIKTLILCGILLVGLSFVSAYTAPSSTPPGGNPNPPITTLSSPQFKLGGLSVYKTQVPTTNYKLDIAGNVLATGMNISGGLDVAGSIKAESLKHSSTNDQKICVNKDGNIVLCSSASEILYFYVYDGEKKFVIPSPGVKDNKIIIEMWGGGGSSYGNRSEDGEDSYFKNLKQSPTFTVIAGGGKSGNYRNGGLITTTGTLTNVSFLTKVNGTDGSVGKKGSSSSNTYCALQNPPISITIGGYGGGGGSGGSSGNTASTSGGLAGEPGEIKCPVYPNTPDSPGSLGANGFNGLFPGGGASGWGGRGGTSFISRTFDYPEYINGEDGVAGGGGGAYSKFEVKVNVGEEYLIKAGKGGNGFHYLVDSPSWPRARDGADGLIKITYEL